MVGTNHITIPFRVAVSALWLMGWGVGVLGFQVFRCPVCGLRFGIWGWRFVVCGVGCRGFSFFGLGFGVERPGAAEVGSIAGTKWTAAARPYPHGRLRGLRCLNILRDTCPNLHLKSIA